MQPKLFLLLFLSLVIHPTYTAESNSNTESQPLFTAPATTERKMTTTLNSEEAQQLLILMKKNNTTIDPENIPQKCLRNTKRFLASPCSTLSLLCATPEERKEDLVRHIIEQKLTINGEDLATALGPKDALQMKELFEKDQKKEVECYFDQDPDYQLPEDACCAVCSFVVGGVADGCILSHVSSPAALVLGPAVWGTCIGCAACKICSPRI